MCLQMAMMCAHIGMQDIGMVALRHVHVGIQLHGSIITVMLVH